MKKRLNLRIQNEAYIFFKEHDYELHKETDVVSKMQAVPSSQEEKCDGL